MKGGKSMNKHQNRIAVTLLAALLLLPSCSGGGTPAAADTVQTAAADTRAEIETTTEAGRANAPDNLPEEIDFDGAVIRILARVGDDATSREFVAEESSGDIVLDAVYRRNCAVEERLNAVIELIPASDNRHSGTEVNGLVTKSIAASADDYDIAANHMAQFSPLLIQGYFSDLRQYKAIDWEQPWWTQSYNSAVTLSDRTYACAGELASTILSGTFVTYFNKKVAQDWLPDTDLYGIVGDGGFTLDRLYGITSGIYSDVNGDGKADYSDIYGLSYVNGSIQADALEAGSRLVFTAYDSSEGTYKWVLENERTSSFLDRADTLLNHNRGAFVSATPTDYNEYCPNKLKFDTTLFTFHFLSTTDDFRDMVNDYGILPIPKLDESQNGYSTTVHNGFSVMAIPVTCTRGDIAATYLEAACAESYRVVTPAYYDVALKIKYVRDPEASDMLDRIVSGISFDFCYLYNSSLNSASSFLRGILGDPASIGSALSSIAAREAQTNEGLKKVTDAYRDIAG